MANAQGDRYRFLCIESDDPLVGVSVLTVLPRIVVDRDVLWGDIHGMPLAPTIDRVGELLERRGARRIRMGASNVPVAARVAALNGEETVTCVASGREREFLASHRIRVLEPSPKLANFFSGTGIETCGELARLTSESCEVRFGREGVILWRLARADDPRLIFDTIPRALPSASLEWTDYTLRRAERLLFVINRLCGSVCDMLRSRGQGAVAIVLRFSLANHTVYEHPLRAARATSSQNAWLRLLRLELERIVLPDAVTGISLSVDLAGSLGSKQGDVFDLGFGTAHAAEEAIAGLLDDQGSIVVEPENTLHPMLDRRTVWTHLDAEDAVERHTRTEQDRRGSRRARETSAQSSSRADARADAKPALTLQLYPEPQRITVGTIDSFGKNVPHTYRDGRQNHRVVKSAGPDRIAGGWGSEEYSREYYRCVNEEGTLVWMYRDTGTNAWYLQGWWD